MARSTPERQSARRTIGTVLCAVLSVGLLWGSAAPASAHDQLVSTEPADGSTVASAPATVVATFSSDLIDLSQDMIVTTPDGTRLTGLDVTVSGRQVSAQLPDGLGAGDYTVAWRVVSSDGHPIEGRYGFTVAGGGPAPTRSASVVATAAPTPVAGAAPSAGPSVPTPIWAAAAAVVVLVIGAMTFVLRRRRD